VAYIAAADFVLRHYLLEAKAFVSGLAKLGRKNAPRK